MKTDSKFRTLVREAGIGRLVLNAYHRPLGLIRSSIREGGPLQQWRTECGRRGMIEAATLLPALKAPERGRGYEVHFVTGANYWYQTLFCAWSLQANAAVRIVPIVYD